MDTKTLKNKRYELEQKVNKLNHKIRLEEIFQLQEPTSINSFKQNNGGHFFDASAMAYFKSKVESGIINGFFITSEKHQQEPRAYSIRTATPSINTIGNFQGFRTEAQARTFLSKFPNFYCSVLEIAITSWNMGDIRPFKRAMRTSKLKKAVVYYLANGEHSATNDFVLLWVLEQLKGAI